MRIVIRFLPIMMCRRRTKFTRLALRPDETFQKFIDKMKQKSYDDTGVNVTKDDHIMTLSTCSTTGKRFVVHAVRIGEHALEK